MGKIEKMGTLLKCGEKIGGEQEWRQMLAIAGTWVGDSQDWCQGVE